MSDRRHHGHPTDVVTHAHAHAKLRLQHVSHGHVITSVIVFVPVHNLHRVHTHPRPSSCLHVRGASREMAHTGDGQTWHSQSRYVCSRGRLKIAKRKKALERKVLKIAQRKKKQKQKKS